MSLLHEIASDFQEAERDLGSPTALINGSTYYVVPSAEGAVVQIDERGNQNRVGFKLMARAAQFSERPQSGWPVVWQDRPFMVMDVTLDPAQKLYTLVCVDPDTPTPG